MRAWRISLFAIIFDNFGQSYQRQTYFVYPKWHGYRRVSMVSVLSLHMQDHEANSGKLQRRVMARERC